MSPELAAPSDRYLPHFGKLVARTLRAGERATVHYWSGQTELVFACDLGTPGLRLDAHALRADKPGFYRTVPWRAVFMLETKVAWHLDPRRLCMLPRKLAREVAASLDADADTLDREQWALRDALRRALTRGRMFAGGEYALGFVEGLEARRPSIASLAYTRDGLDERPHQFAPLGWQDRIPRRADNDNDREANRAVLEQLGMLLVDGRLYTRGPVDVS